MDIGGRKTEGMEKCKRGKTKEDSREGGKSMAGNLLRGVHQNIFNNQHSQGIRLSFCGVNAYVSSAH
jgi:hypothetical protein